jgi:hypothetical protein
MTKKIWNQQKRKIAMCLPVAYALQLPPRVDPLDAGEAKQEDATVAGCRE